MATRFPKFSQGLAQDPTTRRIWFAIATSHDFESHDGMTELRIVKVFIFFFSIMLLMSISFPCLELFSLYKINKFKLPIKLRF